MSIRFRVTNSYIIMVLQRPVQQGMDRAGHLHDQLCVVVINYWHITVKVKINWEKLVQFMAFKNMATDACNNQRPIDTVCSV